MWSKITHSSRSTLKSLGKLDEVEALTGVTEHLFFVEKLIKRTDIPPSIQPELRQQVDHIQRRVNDPTLYLAVVGEFSSGKSTFINGLLRDELLKTSAKVSTAAATRLQHGKEIEVEVKFKDSNAPGKISFKRVRDRKTIPWLSRFQKLNTRQFIHQITTEDTVAKDLQSVTITHPAGFLENGIVIIDTPGSNAINAHHSEVTRQIIEQEADAALIMIPATMPLSQTLCTLLKGPLRHYLHRCIMVVTRMDQIRVREQAGLLSDLQARLMNQMNLDSPVLYPCAAQVLLDDLNGESDISERILVWKDRFIQLEETILSRLRQERSLSVAESLIRLLSKLFEQLEMHLRSQWQHYEQTQKVIEREIIPDLRAFSIEQHQICQRIIEDALASHQNKVRSCFEKGREETFSEIRSIIFDATDWESLSSIVESEASSILNTKSRSLQQSLQTQANSLTESGKQAGQLFDEKFAKAYQRLQVIGGQVKAQNTEIINNFKLTTTDVFSAMKSHDEEILSKSGNLKLGGAGAGAVIGTMIAPGIGTAVGAAIGFFSSTIFGPSLMERKQQLWDKLRPELDIYFDDAKEAAQQANTRYAQSISQSLDQHIDAYISRYQATVDRIQAKQQNELSRLNHLQENIHTDLKEIDRRRQSLLEQQKRLVTTKG